MASKNSSASGVVYLDTSSAQSALDKLNAKIKAYDAELTKTTTSAARRMTIESDRAKAAEKAATIQQQIEKGLGATYSQQSKYVAELTRQVKNLAVGSEEYKQKLLELRKAQGVFDEMKQKVNGVKKVQEELGSSFSRVLTRVVEYAAAYFAFDQVKSFLSDSVEEADQAEKSLSRLKNTLDNIGRADALDRLVNKATELADRFKYLDNDDITEVFQQLITYGKLTENQMNQLLPVIINFAAKSGISVNEGASVVIKAMEGNAKALKEYGINIKEGSNVTERFGILMEQLKPKVEGAADAFSETFAGKAAIAKQEVANLKEEIGNKLIPVLGALYNSVSYAIDGVKSLFSNLFNYVSTTYERIKITIGIAKDLASLNTTGAAARLATYATEQQQAQRAADAEKERVLIQAQVNSIVNENASKSLKDQQEVLKANILLKEDSFKVYNDLVNQGKQNSAEGHKAALQLATDAAVVVGLQKMIAQAKDKRVLGNGDPNADPNADKKAEAAEKKREQEQKQLLKELEAFQFELSQVGKKADESEIGRITNKYNELIKKAAEFGVGYVNLEKQKNGAIAILHQQELDDNRKKFYKQAEEDAKAEYQNQLAISAEYFDGLKDQQQRKYADEAITKKQYEDSIKLIDKGSRDQQIQTAEDYSKTVKAAEIDLNQFRKQKRKEDLADDLQNSILKKEIESRNTLASAQNKVSTSTPNTQARLTADKDLLNVQMQQALSNENLTEQEKENIRVDYRKKEEDATQQYYVQQVQFVLTAVSSAIDIIGKLNQAQTNRENAAFNKEVKQNDTRKKQIQKLADSHVISSEDAAQRIAAIDAEQDKKKADLEKKQFERNKKQQMAQAAVNGALAITNIWATTPKYDFGVSTYIMLAASAIATLASIAEIASQEFAEGGMVRANRLKNGKVNTARNIPTKPNGDNVLATVRVGEVLLNEQQQAALGGDDTFRRIGVPGFGSGGRVKPFWKNRPFESLNYPRINTAMQQVRAYAMGGLVTAQATGNGQPVTTTDPAIAEALQQSQAVNMALLDTLDNLNAQLAAGITSTISQLQIDQGEQKKQRRIALGGFKS